MPENRWHIESKMREMSPKRVTLPTLHGFRIDIITSFPSGFIGLPPPMTR